jgi:hypothetical protein
MLTLIGSFNKIVVYDDAIKKLMDFLCVKRL